MRHAPSSSWPRRASSAALLLLFFAALSAGCGGDSEDPRDAASTGGGSGSGGAGVGNGGSAAGTGGASPCPGDGGAGGSATTGSITGLTLGFERPTPEQIGLHLVATRPLPPDSRASIRYKRTCDTDWQTAHPLLRIHPEWIAEGAPEPPVDGFAGTIFDLEPGTVYDLELTLDEPGGGTETLITQAATRALPAPAPAATATASPSDDLQARFDALMPGDVLELQNGTYDVSGLYLASSGTETQPITIVGESREGVVLRAASGTILQLQEASHVVFENFTMEGSGADSGTDASSVGVSFWDGAVQELVTFRNLDIRGVDQGIIGHGTMRSVLVYDCTLTGNNVWDATFVESNLTWNDDGITLPGEGNCAFSNTLHGFGDSFAVRDGVHSAGVYFYRNRISMTGDDSFEGDYATRNIAFYDNYITNSSTLLSLDPLWGGPLYCFRNIAINTVRGPFKLNNTNSGFLIYSNTIVRTEGTTGWGWVQFNNGGLRGWAYRNNILVYRGATGDILAIESSDNDPIDFTHNAWHPDGAVWWSASGGSYASIADALSSLPPTTPLFGTATSRHEGDVTLASEPFASAIMLGPDHLTEVGAADVPSLAADTNAKNAGTEVPNVTDGYSGAAPDMGAIIEGRPVPAFGAAR
jgi:hypothetical protein